jgi:geranylgeranylglycerol-phosphate geranylgeranyltransferase
MGLKSFLLSLCFSTLCVLICSWHSGINSLKFLAKKINWNFLCTLKSNRKVSVYQGSNILKHVCTIFELLRWKHCCWAGFSALVGTLIAFFIISDSMQIQLVYEPIIVFLVVFLITGAGNAVNDYFDYQIDRVNRPNRPIPSGRIKRKTALRLSVSLFGIGIILSFSLGPLCLFLAAFNSILLFLYAITFKRTVLIGNVVVAYLTGSTFIFGSALEIFNYECIQYSMILFLLAFFPSLVREIVLDIDDMEGDRQGGAETLPIKIGRTYTARITTVVGMIYILLSPIPYIFNTNNLFGIPYLTMTFLADMLLLLSLNEILLKDNAEKSSKMIERAMCIALLAFVVSITPSLILPSPRLIIDF